jgi:hypothetical protein
MSGVLRILEPNLSGNAGHYAEFARALADRCAPRFDRLEVHGGAGMHRVELLDHESIAALPSCAEASESRVLRRLSGDGQTPLLILTAKARHAVELELLHWGLRHDPAHVTLFFHWREDGPSQRIAMSMARTVRRKATALAPTATTAAFLCGAGWRNVMQIAYPARAPTTLPELLSAPTHLLVAGAARLNKGIHLIAQLADRYAQSQPELPMLVQTTGKRAGRHGAAEHAPLEQLEQCAWRGLHLDASAPNRDEYARRFSGALVLTPYDPVHFRDNVSGIALDALLHGAPIIATSGTWQARLVERFGCGVCMKTWSADCLQDSIEEAVRRWTDISDAAFGAAVELAAEHDPRHVIEAIAQG